MAAGWPAEDLFAIPGGRCVDDGAPHRHNNAFSGCLSPSACAPVAEACTPWVCVHSDDILVFRRWQCRRLLPPLPA